MTETFCTQISVIGPALWVALLAFFVMAVDIVVPKRNTLLQAVSLLGLGTIFASSLCQSCCVVPTTGFFGMLSRDAFTGFFDLLFIAIAFLSIAMSGPYYEKTGIKLPETLSLKLLATVGAMLMVNTNDLIVLFVALELMSISLYALAGMLYERPKSNEAAMKYFLLGAFSTGFFLYGIALLYGTTGSTNYQEISSWIVKQNGQFGSLFWAGIGLLLIGFFFKTASVPFHF
ncbi:MAG: proton-conducting transporter membrane subunit [bacterium]|nr:proton-conducting transporter membrane subunit [bacterium]